MAAKTNEGGSEEASRKLSSSEKGKNRAVRRKSDRLLVGISKGLISASKNVELYYFPQKILQKQEKQRVSADYRKFHIL